MTDAKKARIIDAINKALPGLTAEQKTSVQTVLCALYPDLVVFLNILKQDAGLWEDLGIDVAEAVLADLNKAYCPAAGGTPLI